MFFGDVEIKKKNVINRDSVFEREEIRPSSLEDRTRRVGTLVKLKKTMF